MPLRYCHWKNIVVWTLLVNLNYLLYIEIDILFGKFTFTTFTNDPFKFIDTFLTRACQTLRFLYLMSMGFETAPPQSKQIHH